MRTRGLLPGVAVATLLGAGGFALAGPGAEDCVAQAGGTADVEAKLDCGAGSGGAPVPGTTGATGACRSATLFSSVGARRTGSRLRLTFSRRAGTTGTPVAELFRVTRGNRATGNRRVARLTRAGTVGRGLADGIYFARFRLTAAGRSDVRRIALRRRDGRFARRPDFYRRDSCATLSSFKLSSPAFGGTTGRSLGIAYRVAKASRVTVTVTRDGRTVRRFAARTTAANRTVRLRLRSADLRRGDHRVTLSARPTAGGAAVTARLVSARL